MFLNHIFFHSHQAWSRHGAQGAAEGCAAGARGFPHRAGSAEGPGGGPTAKGPGGLASSGTPGPVRLRCSSAFPSRALSTPSRAAGKPGEQCQVRGRACPLLLGAWARGGEPGTRGPGCPGTEVAGAAPQEEGIACVKVDGDRVHGPCGSSAVWGREDSWQDAGSRMWSPKAWAGGSWFAAGGGAGGGGGGSGWAPTLLRTPGRPRPKCQLSAPRQRHHSVLKTVSGRAAGS